MVSFATTELKLGNSHMAFVKKGDLVIFDHGYPSYEWIFTLAAKGADFLFRMKDQWWNCVKEFEKSGKKDHVITLGLPARYCYLLRKYPHLKKEIQVRLIKKTNRKGKTQIFLTSLVDNKQYSSKSILNLYKQRWFIEEAYKMINSRMELVRFSGLPSWAVQQDFYAKTALISLNNTLIYDIKPVTPKRRPIKRARQKRVPIINRTYAMHQLKKLFIKMILNESAIGELLNKNFNRIRKKIEYSRINQNIQRIFKSDTKYAGNYRVV